MPTLQSLSSVILGNGCRLAFGEVLETRALDPARTMVTLSNEYSAEEATYHSCLDAIQDEDRELCVHGRLRELPGAEQVHREAGPDVVQFGRARCRAGGGISSNTPSGSLAYNQQLLRNLLDVVNSLPSQLAGHGTVVGRKYTAYAPAMGFPANRGDPDKLRRYVGSANVACGKLERRISTLNEAAQLNAARRFIENDKLTNLQAQAEAAAAEIEVCVDAAVQRGAFQPLPPVKTGAIPGAPKLMCSETIAGDGGGADPGFPVPKGVLDQARGAHLYVAVATLGKANAKEVGQTPRAGLTVVFDDQDPQHAKVAWPPGDPWDYYAADQPYLYSKYAAVPIPPDTPAVHIFLPQGAAPHERWSVKVWV